MVKAQRLELHCPKTLQSGDDLMYAKKEIQADPLAFAFDRVPFPVEYIRGPAEWEQMNARSLPQHPRPRGSQDGKQRFVPITFFIIPA